MDLDLGPMIDSDLQYVMDLDLGHVMDLDSGHMMDSDSGHTIIPGGQLLSFFSGSLESGVGAACEDRGQFVAQWKNSGVMLAPISLIFYPLFIYAHLEDHL
jgi:hypothetical protein